MADLRINGWSDESLTNSGSNYLTLAGKSRFWYQISPGWGGGLWGQALCTSSFAIERAGCFA